MLFDDVARHEPDEEPYGTCDWGYCDEPATVWRWSESLGEWLPVCPDHEGR
jgi:hypothetical protein